MSKKINTPTIVNKPPDPNDSIITKIQMTKQLQTWSIPVPSSIKNDPKKLHQFYSICYKHCTKTTEFDADMIMFQVAKEMQSTNHDIINIHPSITPQPTTDSTTTDTPNAFHIMHQNKKRKNQTHNMSSTMPPSKKQKKQSEKQNPIQSQNFLFPGKIRTLLNQNQTWYLKQDNVYMPNEGFLGPVISRLWKLDDSKFRTYTKRNEKSRSTDIVFDYLLTAIAWIAFQFTTDLKGKIPAAKKIKMRDKNHNWLGMAEFLRDYRESMMSWTTKQDYRLWIGIIIHNKWPSRYIDMNRKNGKGIHPDCVHYAYYNLLGVVGQQGKPKDDDENEVDDDNDDDDVDDDDKEDHDDDEDEDEDEDQDTKEEKEGKNEIEEAERKEEEEDESGEEENTDDENDKQIGTKHPTQGQLRKRKHIKHCTDVILPTRTRCNTTTNQKIHKSVLRDNAEYETTTRGNHTDNLTDTTLVRIGTSIIPGARFGVFAHMDLVENQVLTRYEGLMWQCRPDCRLTRQYTIAVKQKNTNGPEFLYLVGIMKPEIGAGLGSFINHSEEKQNCEFVVDTKSNSVWVIAIKNINKDQELYATYGEEYDYRHANIKQL